MNQNSNTCRNNIKVIRINDQIRTIRQTSRSPLIRSRNFIQQGSQKDVVLQTSPNICPIKITDRSEERRRTSIENGLTFDEIPTIKDLRSRKKIPIQFQGSTVPYINKKSYEIQNQLELKPHRELMVRSTITKKPLSPITKQKLAFTRKTICPEKDSPSTKLQDKPNIFMLGSNRRIKMRVDDDDDNDDNLSEKSAKSVVWNETDLDQLVGQEFIDELNQQDQFVLLYKYRYEKEHNKLQQKQYQLQQSLSKQQLESHLKKIGINCKNINQEIINQNFAFDNKIQDEQNFKQFFQLTLQKEAKKSFLPKIN